jgi:hypothetical protein
MSSRSSSFPSITTEDAELPHHAVAVYMLNNLPPASPPTIFLSDPPALQLPSSGIKPSAARANDKASSTSHHTSRPIIVKRQPRVSIPAFEDDGDGSRTKQWLNSNIPRSLRRLAEAAKKRNFWTPSPLIEVPTAYQRPRRRRLLALRDSRQLKFVARSLHRRQPAPLPQMPPRRPQTTDPALSINLAACPES